VGIKNGCSKKNSQVSENTYLRGDINVVYDPPVGNAINPVSNSKIKNIKMNNNYSFTLEKSY